MSRSNRSKIAVTLLSALAFGANAQAQDLSKNKITKEVISKKVSDKNEIVRTDSFSICKNVAIGILAASSAVEAANETVAGVRWGMGKESDSIIKGKYSIVNGVRLMLNGNKDVQNPKEKDNQDHGKKNYENLKKLGESPKGENDEKLENLLKQFADAAKDRPGLFEIFEIGLKNTYKKCQNKSYQWLANDDMEKKLAGAVINFIAGKKICETDLAVNGLESCPNYSYFLVKCGDTNVNLVAPVDGGLLCVIFNGRMIVDFRDN